MTRCPDPAHKGWSCYVVRFPHGESCPKRRNMRRACTCPDKAQHVWHRPPKPAAQTPN